MKILILIFFFILSNCTLNKVNNHHGVHFLKKKNESLIIKKTNKNDIIKLLGQPSTESKFDNDLWIYIEREITRGKLLKLGKNITYKNNILILEFDRYGVLKKKELLDKNKMQKVKFDKNAFPIHFVRWQPVVIIQRSTNHSIFPTRKYSMKTNKCSYFS